MATVIWTGPARRELREVQQWIGRDSRQYAAATAQRVLAATARLEDFPESGRLVPEHREAGIREVVVGSYRAIYRYAQDRDAVVVLTVVHARRRLPPMANGS